MNLTIPTTRRASLAAKVFTALLLAGLNSYCAAAQPPIGDGWQMLSAATSNTGPVAALPSQAVALANLATAPTSSLAVAPVVLPGAPVAPAGDLTFSVTPQDVNLRNALDRWLQTQGWQLAWKIDDDLPLEFNASFSGDFTAVLTQVMKATNHMRTPTRICRHTNHVIRVIARAANCQD
ncbi:pilus assembly protein [Burkholderia sp. SRS-W-2-2016]|uniref:toxin co-regulated pilus biosynthesis Q family protein n=1 Tax=Burkholderia sp. SRS-W-2-2016 TaxID=1926878 RepID=UPI00094AF379|nr:toxin co-regulated pilus biosynthesis Q family protein [Burkholderia sp. SRS-W-2-2016]OLL27787.1 pilus assembly protein [Burkholderia sp. SRS-W-2-2016]